VFEDELYVLVAACVPPKEARESVVG